MKRFISYLLCVCLTVAAVFVAAPKLNLATAAAITDEEIAAKNYPIPENSVVCTVINTFDTASDCDGNISTEDGTYYDGGSKKITSDRAWMEQSVPGKRFHLDGNGFMIWYKSKDSGVLRIRSETNAIIVEANVPASPDGVWLTYHYYGKCENFTFKTDMNSDIRSKISPDMTYSLSITSMSSTVKEFYFDEFFTFAPPITPADTYDNSEQFFKFSAARMGTKSAVKCEYYDDGSVKLSTVDKPLSQSSISISYNIDADQAAGALAIANQGSGYLAIKVDNISCKNSSSEDETAYISLTIGGYDRKLQKYIYGSGSSEVYLIKTSDMDIENAEETLENKTINIVISGGNVSTAQFKLSPVTVHHFPEGEIILQAEDLSPKVKMRAGEEDALLYSDTDLNRTYVYANDATVQYLSFELPQLEVGEYELYASCSAIKNTLVKYSVAINNLRQVLDVLFTDETYTSNRHITDIPMGKIKITKDYSDGASNLKLVPMPNGWRQIYIDYFSLKKTDTQVDAEPSANFEIKPYPETENFEVKSVLNTFDDYICGSDGRYYVENQVAGYVGDGNAFNLNSRGTLNKGWFDNNFLYSGNTGSLDGDGIRFWYKGAGAELIFYGANSSISYKLNATDGDWITILYKDIVSGGDMSHITAIAMKTTSATEYYIDELHTIQQMPGDIIYEKNGDGTASVVGYNLRIEDVTVADTYEGCPVTTIKAGALSGSLSLKSVTLPDSVTSIEAGAFEGDVNLKSIVVGSGLNTIGENAFLNCKNLGETVLPASVNSIADTAFMGCEKLILDVTDGSYAKSFAMIQKIDYRCKNAQFEYLVTGNETSGYKAALTKWLSNSGTAIIPETVDGVDIVDISDGAFENNGNVKSVTMSSVVSIGKNAFANCAKLEDVNLGEKITSIGEGAFKNDNKIMKITLPDTLSSISDTAFSGANQDIVADVVRDSYAYKYVNTAATAMKQIPDTQSDFKYSLYMYEASIIGYTGSDTVLSIPDYIDGYPVISIGEGAFAGNDKITYVKFSSKCKTIGKEAFSGCSALVGFDIGGVYRIKELSFYNCVSLGNITLTNVTQYESNSFLGCPNLKISFLQTQFSRSATELVESWHAGINLGNTFDSCNADKTYGTLTVNQSECLWGAPTTTKDMIDFLADSGFDVFRLPVTWYAFVNDADNYKIDDEYMDRIQEVVDWAISNGMYVVLNVHHDTVRWLDLNKYSAETCRKFERIWEQIADRFKDYDEHLIFESLNESRAGEDWDANSSSGLFAKFDDLQKRFYKVVRSSGGYNDVRYLMLETYGAQAKAKHCSSVWYPSVDEDNHVIMSTHHYNNNIGEHNFNTEFGVCKQYFNDKGIPCVIGETGRQNYWDDESQGQWTKAMLNSAENNGLKVIFWDDHGSFGMYDRTKLEWLWPSQIKAIMDRAYPETVYTVTIDGVPLNNSSNTVVLPESDKPGFVCYTDGTNCYSENETVTITDHLILTSVFTGELEMTLGASMKISDDTSGIRYFASADYSALSRMIDLGAKVECGMLIAKYGDIKADGLTVDNATAVTGGSVKYDDISGIVKIIGDVPKNNADKLIGSVVDISSDNAKVQFIGRAYITVTVGNVTKTVYADFSSGSAENSVRSVKDIAAAAKASNSAEYRQYKRIFDYYAIL